MAVSKPINYVVDCSVFTSFLLPDEKLATDFTSVFDKFLKHQINFLAPPILKYEIGNVLKSSLNRKRITVQEALEIFNAFLEFDIEYVTTNYSKTFQLSTKYNLTFYDASYLCLAQEKKAKLLTLDQKLLTCLPK